MKNCDDDVDDDDDDDADKERQRQWQWQQQQQQQQFVKFVLISGNVGSLFENVTLLMTQWVDEIAVVVEREQPKFVAIHLQEVGGKNYANGMKFVETFRNYLIEHNAFGDFDRCLVLSDEDFANNEHFTALGNLYFIHKTIRDVTIWDFQTQTFHPVTKKQIFAGQIEDSSLKEKSKFPQHFSPPGKCSRKGFMRTRWSIEGIVMDFVNVHLFHDISNFVAMESFPSTYSSNRSKALNYLLDRLSSPSPLPLPLPSLPAFIFGDFNFRLDTKSFIDEITKSTERKSTINSEIHYYDSNNEPVLILGNKTFIFNQKRIFLENPQQLKKHDKELQSFESNLHELAITFPPSYPFEETVTKPNEYMQTRCPAWCDRILFNSGAKSLIESTPNVKYNLIGIDKCMGDHKPIYCGFEVSLQHFKENPVAKNTKHSTSCCSYVSISGENQSLKLFKQTNF